MNVPIAVLIWLMIIPMMMKVDFGAIRNVGQTARLDGHAVRQLAREAVLDGIDRVALFRFVLAVDPSGGGRPVHRRCIILAAAPCTAMVFVWSYLTDGDPAYTLVQVSVNDLIMLVLFAPIVTLFVRGASFLEVPFIVLLYSVFAFIVIPLAVGVLLRLWLTHAHGREWFNQVLPAQVRPVTILALLATLVLIFGFQSENIRGRYSPCPLDRHPHPASGVFQFFPHLRPHALVKVEHSVAAPARSLAPAISLSSLSPPQLLCLGLVLARRLRPSSVCWSKCRSCSLSATPAIEPVTGSLRRPARTNRRWSRAAPTSRARDSATTRWDRDKVVSMI